MKDIAALLDAKRASIDVAEAYIAEIRQIHPWRRADKEEYYLRLAEVRGMKTSYNQLAATYNAGATTPLPREFKPYDIEEGPEK
jgi:hypothetical protein